jgi:hypothetical protein
MGSGLGSYHSHTILGIMSRPIRIEFPNARYHVTSRGDRQGFVDTIAQLFQGRFKTILVEEAVPSSRPMPQVHTRTSQSPSISVRVSRRWAESCGKMDDCYAMFLDLIPEICSSTFRMNDRGTVRIA